ncbi:MAG: hypothetical protein NUV80_02875 [Candidatus Berkelbacteria bacterium]|nr:hypothetical protein [Candidatus Berkelbacteria bacterium]
MTEQKQAGSQMRITPLEMNILKNTFKGNEELLRLMRKIFLPELDPFTPIGQNIDLWMTVKVEDMTPEQALINIKARNSLIMHLDQCLNTMKILAESTETPEELEAKIKKNQTK